MLRTVMVVLFCLASAALAQEYQSVRSEDGRCSVEVPASWKVTVGGAKPTSLLRFQATIPGLEGIVICNVWLLQGQRNAYAQPFLDGPAKRAQQGARSATPAVVPFSHLVVEYDDVMEATAYAMVRRNGVNTQLACDPAAWPKLRDGFLHMAGSMRAELEEWPPHPPSLRRETKDGFVYLVDPSVKESDLSRLQSLVSQTQSDFEKQHGKAPMPEENPPLVVVHNTLAEARTLYDGVSQVHDGAAVDELGGRVFLTPVPVRRGPERAACAREVAHLLYIQRYGWNEALWMYNGEGLVAWSEERCGQHPPKIDEKTFRILPTRPITFKALVGMDGRSGDEAFRGNALAYALFFRAGPRKYRDAYEAFVAELGATYDPERTAAGHLLSLDQAEMRDDLEKWLRRSIKVVEQR